MRLTAQRVRFGEGAIDEVADAVAELEASRALIVCTPGRRPLALRVAEQLGDRHVATFEDAAMHTPVEVTERALRLTRRVEADAVVALGGGSAIGLAKALAVRTGMPQLAAPTTYSGSEATPVVGETRDGVKTTRRDSAAVVDSVIYDPELTYELPSRASVASGINALAHAAEALYAPDADAAVRERAAGAVRALAGSLPVLADDPRDRAARRAALRGAWDAGACLASAAMGLHHQLAHILGGRFGLPHAQTHAVLLPHVLAYNLPAAPQARAVLADALETDDPVTAIRAIARAGRIPSGLAALGLGEADLAAVAEQAVASPYPNPRTASAADIHALLAGALTPEDLDA